MEFLILLNTYMIIYRLLSPSGKSYIGKTKFTVEKRLYGHIANWKHKRGCSKLFNAFSKYGIPDIQSLGQQSKIEDKEVLVSWRSGNWIVQVVCQCSSVVELNERERELIKKYDSIENGYNLCRGGEGHTGPQTEYQKQRLREFWTGRKRGPLSPEQRLRRSVLQKGKPSNRKGKSCSEEHKRKLSLARLNYLRRITWQN